MSCITSVHGVKLFFFYLISQLSRDVTGRLSVKPHEVIVYEDIIKCHWYVSIRLLS